MGHLVGMMVDALKTFPLSRCLALVQVNSALALRATLTIGLCCNEVFAYFFVSSNKCIVCLVYPSILVLRESDIVLTRDKAS